MLDDRQSPVVTAFVVFPKLPEELRCLIWATAALRRPRVIQLCNDPTTNTWHAWKDGCGGLPSIMKVSKEARKEALKGYTWAFGTFVDLEDDTIFISDPVFSLRRQQRAFFNADHTNRLRKVAMSLEVYDGLEQSANEFPKMCLPPTSILRKIGGLTHFMLVLSEDGEGDLYGDSTDVSEAWPDSAEDGEGDRYDDNTDLSDALRYAVGEQDPGGRDSDIEEVDVRASPSQIGLVPLEDSEEIKDHRLSRQLSHLEKDALEDMRGYLRQPGNIHFASALRDVDHWDDAMHRKEVVTYCFDKKKRKHPQWVRPMFSVMVVKYGLKRLCDFREPVHDQGDFSDIDVEDSNFYLYDDQDPIGTAWDSYSCAADNFACAADGYSDEDENGEANLDELQGY